MSEEEWTHFRLGIGSKLLREMEAVSARKGWTPEQTLQKALQLLFIGIDHQLFVEEKDGKLRPLEIV